MTDPVIADISSAIRVRHIRTPGSDVSPIKDGDEQGQVLALMTRHQYDASPVLGDSGVTGLLWREDLLDTATPVSEAMRGLAAEMLIEARAPLTDLVARFREGQRFLLVLDGRGIDGVVTPSDLGKQAGRTHLFMEISALELGLAEEARSLQDGDAAALQALLPADRVSAAKRRRNAKSKRDEDVDFVGALDFGDLLLIGQQLAPENDPAWSSISGGERESLKHFRNSVMHAVLQVTSDEDTDVEGLIHNTSLISDLLRRFV